MLRVTLWHEPEGFHFYLRDPTESDARRPSVAATKERQARGFVATRRGMSIRTISEFSTIAIDVEYDVDGFEDDSMTEWDHVVECSLQTTSGRFVFEGCTDPEPFGVLDVPEGGYRVRIHFGGQQSGKADGSSDDFYLVRIWPGNEGSTIVLKGDEVWPRPEQQWERERRLGPGDTDA